MSRRTFLSGAAIGALSACGGGSVALSGGNACAGPVPLVGWYGDSLTSGLGLAVSPVARALQLLQPRARCIDYSWPGRTVDELRWGWPARLRVEPSTVLVLRMGGADALGGRTPEQFLEDLDAAVSEALSAGKRVVLPGIVHVARKPEFQDAIGIDDQVFARIVQRSADLDRVVRAVALRRAVPFVDIRALRFDGSADIADAVHPAQDYSNRCADAIVGAVLPLL